MPTNTIATIYSAATSGFSTTYDALVGLAVAVMVVGIGFALVSGMFRRRIKVK